MKNYQNGCKRFWHICSVTFLKAVRDMQVFKQTGQGALCKRFLSRKIQLVPSSEMVIVWKHHHRILNASHLTCIICTLINQTFRCRLKYYSEQLTLNRQKKLTSITRFILNWQSHLRFPVQTAEYTYTITPHHCYRDWYLKVHKNASQDATLRTAREETLNIDDSQGRHFSTSVPVLHTCLSIRHIDLYFTYLS